MGDGRGFIGRRGELSILKDGLAAAFDGGGRLFLLTGEPGIGKTRVAAEFADHARDQGARVVWGRCWEGAGAPAYWPWVRAIRSLLQDLDSESLLELMGPGGSDLAQILPELQALFPELPPLPSRDADSARFQLFDSTASFLIRAARVQPIVVVLDDIHSADIPSLLFLRFIAGQLADARIVLVAIYRHGELTPDHPLTGVASQLAREPTTREIRLVGLGESEIASFLEAVTRRQPEPGLVARLVRETTGNPLYLEQTVRLHTAEDRLRELSEAELLHLTVPARISDLILRRVDHLSDRCGDALRRASILGSEFRFEVLRRLVECSSEEMIDVLDEAEDAGLVLTTADPSPIFTFSHDLVRQALYESLSRNERVALHAEAATVLESTYGQDAESHMAELAHHFFEAMPGGYAHQAMHYARLAGANAAGSLAYEEAARLHSMALTALEMLPSFDETMRVEILLDIGEAQTHAGEDERARETFLQAARIAKHIGEAGQLARAALGYGGIFVWQRAGADREIVPLLEEALSMLGGSDDRLRARLLSRLACSLRDSPNRETCDDLSAYAVGVARALDDPDTLCYALEGRFAAIWWPENPEYRLDLARELKQVAEQHELSERVFAGRMWQAVTLADLGLVAEARSTADAAAQEAEHLRQPNQLFLARVIGTLFDLMEGDFRAAEEGILSAIEKGSRARDEYSNTRSQLFLLRREQGRLAEIEDFVRTSVRDFPWYPLHRAQLACLLVELGRHDEAQQVFDDIAHDEFQMLQRDNEWLLGMALAADACAQLDDGDAAAVMYDQLLPFAGRHAVGWGEGSVGAVDRYLGLLAATLGLDTEAADHFEQAIAVNSAMGARPWVAHSQYDYGRLLLARDGPGDQERAGELFAAARDTARALNMAALEDKLAKLDEVAAESPPRPDVVESGVFRREGEYWSVSFRGQAFRLRDTKGLRYLARLLANPGREVHVLDLVGLDAGSSTATADPELRAHDWGAADDVIDPKARAAYEQRLRELSEDLEEAESWNDTERVASIREEMEHLTAELTSAVGLGGRSRKSTSASERARVNVTRAIRSAMTRIADNDPDLGHHFDTTIRTGTFCSYTPDSRVPIDWKL